MNYLSQQDSRWVNVKYNGNYTLGRYGCTITCITMFYNWAFNASTTPDWIAKKLKFSNGLLLWSSLSNIGLKFIYRYYKRDDARIRQALNSRDEGCLLQVNNNHWVLLIGRWIPGLGYKIADPWTGTTCYTNKYKNNITGFAVISR